MKKIKFYIPSFYEFENLNINLINLMNEKPHYFYDNIEIGAVYGTYFGAIWNGGRVVTGSLPQNQDEWLSVKNNMSLYEERNIPIRFTWTNCLLNKTHLNDKFCNLIMKMADNNLNEVIVNSELLENYIREKYPNYKVISSTTKCLTSLEAINNELDKNYFLTVLDYRLNKNEEILKQIENKDKIELLINAYCPGTCKRRSEHYKKMSEAQLKNEELSFEEFPCHILKDNFFDCLKNEMTISVEELYNKYVQMGFSHFKIEGRTNHLADVLESYLYYMVKPEYKDEVRLFLLKQIF